MKKVILCLWAMGICGFFGCSSSSKILNEGNSPGITNDNYSTAYMFRESKLYGSAKAAPIQVNGVQLFRIGNGDCVTFRIPTGQNEIIYVPGWKQLKFVSERSQKYYFYLRVDSEKSSIEFRQLTEEEWNEKQKACNWVELKQ